MKNKIDIVFAFPPPPCPPVTQHRGGFFSLFTKDDETLESKLARARHEGASEMWCKCFDAVRAIKE